MLGCGNITGARQRLVVLWHVRVSKQGAVLSPVLFWVYIGDLLKLLSKARVGCYLGHNFVGALAYAGDIALVASTAAVRRYENSYQYVTNRRGVLYCFQCSDDEMARSHTK